MLTLGFGTLANAMACHRGSTGMLLHWCGGFINKYWTNVSAVVHVIRHDGVSSNLADLSMASLFCRGVKAMILSALHHGRRVPSSLNRAATSAIASPTEKHWVCLTRMSKPSPGWGRRRERREMGSGSLCPAGHCHSPAGEEEEGGCLWGTKDPACSTFLPLPGSGGRAASSEQHRYVFQSYWLIIFKCLLSGDAPERLPASLHWHLFSTSCGSLCCCPFDQDLTAWAGDNPIPARVPATSSGAGDLPILAVVIAGRVPGDHVYH